MALESRSRSATIWCNRCGCHKRIADCSPDQRGGVVCIDCGWALKPGELPTQPTPRVKSTNIDGDLWRRDPIWFLHENGFHVKLWRKVENQGDDFTFFHVAINGYPGVIIAKDRGTPHAYVELMMAVSEDNSLVAMLDELKRRIKGREIIEKQIWKSIGSQGWREIAAALSILPNPKSIASATYNPRNDTIMLRGVRYRVSREVAESYRFITETFNISTREIDKMVDEVQRGNTNDI